MYSRTYYSVVLLDRRLRPFLPSIWVGNEGTHRVGPALSSKQLLVRRFSESVAPTATPSLVVCTYLYLEMRPTVTGHRFQTHPQLARAARDFDLAACLSQEAGGVVSIRVVSDFETGRPKGFAFVEYEDAATALSAIRNLNGYECNNRPVGRVASWPLRAFSGRGVS